ncbi:YibQ protein [Ruegeria lacuscaerulensis ITI-1157]|nr:YibQ protein [Ruegeria lacuscaerulensis ITI-1157]SHJ21045.1 Uncharacterized conserved protein YibQ, putative polysaccharide deacetylase 2 family [Ruegeria lacuscaerulensis ITI-1157]
MGGFFGGMITGLVVVMVLGVILSLNTPLSSKPDLQTDAPLASEVQPPAADSEVADAGPDSDLVELAPRALNAPDDVADATDALAEIQAEPDGRPQVGQGVAAIERPGIDENGTAVVSTDAPVAPQAPAPVPASPDEAVHPVDVDPVPPTAPEPQDQDTIEASGPSPDQGSQPDADSAEIAALPQEPEANVPSVTSQSPIAVEGDEDTAPRKRARIAALPQIGAEPTAPSTSGVGKRVVPLTERDDPPADQTEITQPEAPPGDPIDAYAAPFENPEGKPLMSIVLIDDEGAFGAEALKDFPYPLSFAIDPSDPQAAEKVKRYREAGFEVLILTDLPRSFSAQDAEVSLSVWLEALPETVGLLEGVETGIQGNRRLADQVAAIAGATGRGLVVQDKGLNTVQKLAARNGIPSSIVFRDIDRAGQEADVMRRFLDQAAFRASQEGAVVMLGRLRPETISALLLWGLEDRSSRVALAPISAVMKSQIQ